MRVVTAVENDLGRPGEIKLFLAGGITNCPNWQKGVLERLAKVPDLPDLVVFTPRRDKFPIDDPNASEEQIKWEFDRLQIMDIFSMFFTGGESDQPICLYELGRNLMTMHVKFPNDWQDRIIISCDTHYKRSKDVEIQTSLAADGDLPYTFFSGEYENLLDCHVVDIVSAYNKLINSR